MVVFKRGFKSAMITVELAISLVLVLVVLFVTLGLFSNNLKDMFASSNFKNIFNGEGVRTFFAMFNRNYSNSQIDVQLLGQQGLQVIRKKANNGSLGILDQNTTTNGNGNAAVKTIPGGTATTIGYLSQIVNIIVGNTDICNKMKDESVAKCGIGIPDTKYALTIDKTNNKITVLDKETGKSTLLIAKGGFSFVAASTLENSITDDTSKIKAIESLTNSYKQAGADLSSDYAQDVARDISYYSSNLESMLGSTSGGNSIEAQIEKVMNDTEKSYHSAYTSCNSWKDVIKNKSCNGKLWDKDDVKLTQNKPSYDRLVNAIASYIDFSNGHYDGVVKDYINDANNYVSNSPSNTSAYSGYITPDYVQNSYKPNNNWYNSASNNYVSGSEDALEIARPVNKALQNYANNSGNTSSSLAITNARALNYAMDGDGGGGGGGGGIYNSNPVSSTTTQTGAVVSQNSVAYLCNTSSQVSCNASNDTVTSIKATDVATGQNYNNIAFSQTYVDSPLQSTPQDRIVNAKSALSKVKILDDYHFMMSKAWTTVYKKTYRIPPFGKITGREENSIIHYLEMDTVNKGDSSSCAIFMNGMKKIAKQYGLVSLTNDINSGKLKCTPGGND